METRASYRTSVLPGLSRRGAAALKYLRNPLQWGSSEAIEHVHEADDRTWHVARGPRRTVRSVGTEADVALALRMLPPIG